MKFKVLLANWWSLRRIVRMVDINAEKKAVLQVMEKWLIAEKEKDLETTMSFFVQDAVCLAPDMPILKGYDAVKQFYKGFFEPLLSMDADNAVLDVSESGERAVVTGDFTMVMKTPDSQFTSEGKHLTVLKKVDGKWMCNAVAFNSNAPPP
jgi:uncharacterized protein (TIGR02246 family)